MSNVLFIGHGTLRISDLTQANEGIYQCFAENIYGRTMSRLAELRTAVRDSSRRELNNVAAVEGHSAVIRCHETTKCFPSPRYSWELRSTVNYPVTLDRRRQIDQDGNCCCSL